MDNTKDPHVPGPGGGHHPEGNPTDRPLAPDIAFETNVALQADQLQALIDDIQNQLRDQFPDAKVFVAPDRRRVGIYVDNEMTRSAALKQQGADAIALPVPASLNGIAIKIDGDFIKRSVDNAFAVLPRRYDPGTAQASKDGSLELQSMALNFVPPSTIKTLIHGVVHTVVELGWDATITETIHPSGGTLHVLRRVKLDPDDPLTSILKFIYDVVRYPGGLWVLNDLKNPDLAALSPARPVAQLIELLPKSILIPGGHQKATLAYVTAAIDEGGIAITGSITLDGRHPKATVLAEGVSVFPGETAVVPIALSVHDLRAPLEIHWVASDGTIHHHPAGGGAYALFPTTGHKVGDKLSRTVTATVTDADTTSLTPHTSLTITIVHPPVPTGHEPQHSGTKPPANS